MSYDSETAGMQSVSSEPETHTTVPLQLCAKADWSRPTCGSQAKVCSAAKSVGRWRLRRQPDLGSCFKCNRCDFIGASQLSVAMHVAQRHRLKPGVALQKSKCTEAQLFRLLQSLPPEVRRKVLGEDFSQQQRLKLEQWVLKARQAEKTPKRQNKAKLQPEGGVVSANGNCSSRQAIRRSEASQPRGKRAAQQDGPTASHRGPMRRGGNRELIGLLPKGVSSSVKFSAVSGSLLFHTRNASDEEQAKRFRRVLCAIRHRLATIPYSLFSEDPAPFESPSDALADFIGSIMIEEPKQEGLDPEIDMRLSFSIAVPAGYWVGRRLQTPRYQVSDLRRGLRAWSRLSNARRLIFQGVTNQHSILARHSPVQLESTWAQLRQVYLDCWAEAGYVDMARVEARLQTLEARHRIFRQRLQQRWTHRHSESISASKAVLLHSRSEDARPAQVALRKGSETILLTPASDVGLVEAKIRKLLDRWSR
eukprot:CAMPEP_0178395374 /NCGR_PEP_ID=MMETSP0689_2-20121128/13186_1 /TAXON_ID=160604 /ORGANISM="Amphidinium massartii, Strain CS-259" /LENGTH=477 /DNA_ID=CAMNT_0020016027 /DNA_START=201 /DNA_END=1631 /DNA_ORIENTATION=-